MDLLGRTALAFTNFAHSPSLPLPHPNVITNPLFLQTTSIPDLAHLGLGAYARPRKAQQNVYKLPLASLHVPQSYRFRAIFFCAGLVVR
jgi:hypothetical protein